MLVNAPALSKYYSTIFKNEAPSDTEENEYKFFETLKLFIPSPIIYSQLRYFIFMIN